MWDRLVSDGRVEMSGGTVGDADGDGDVAVDVEGYLRAYTAAQAEADPEAGIALLAAGLPLSGADGASYDTYKALEETNTLTGGFGALSANAEYAKPIVTSISVAFVAPEANRRFASTMLDGSQWLTRYSLRNLTDDEAKTAADAGAAEKNYAFRYDGVFADRTVNNFTSATAATNDPTEGKWDTTSTPTFGKVLVENAQDQLNKTFDGESSRHQLYVDHVKSKDPNAATRVANYTTNASGQPVFSVPSAL